jgi:hypothetical protein
MTYKLTQVRGKGGVVRVLGGKSRRFARFEKFEDGKARGPLFSSASVWCGPWKTLYSFPHPGTRAWKTRRIRVPQGT